MRVIGHAEINGDGYRAEVDYRDARRQERAEATTREWIGPVRPEPDLIEATILMRSLSLNNAERAKVNRSLRNTHDQGYRDGRAEAMRDVWHKVALAAAIGALMATLADVALFKVHTSARGAGSFYGAPE